MSPRAPKRPPICKTKTKKEKKIKRWQHKNANTRKAPSTFAATYVRDVIRPWCVFLTFYYFFFNLGFSDMYWICLSSRAFNELAKSKLNPKRTVEFGSIGSFVFNFPPKYRVPFAGDKSWKCRIPFYHTCRNFWKIEQTLCCSRNTHIAPSANI